MSSLKHDRISRINHGLEIRLIIYTDKLELQKQRFLRNMMQAQAFLKSEYKRLKDEKFRYQNEKKLIRHHESSKSFDLDEFPSTGLLHGPGIQDRFTRQKNLRKRELGSSNESIARSNYTGSSLNLSVKQSPENLSIYQQSITFPNSLEQQSKAHTTPEDKSYKVNTDTIITKRKANAPNIQFISSNPLSTLHVQSEAYISSPSRSCCYQPSASNSERNSSFLRHSQGFSMKSQSARYSRQREIGSSRSRNKHNVPDRKNGEFQQHRRNNVESQQQKQKEKEGLPGRRSHTAHFIDRLSVMKKQIVEEETQYLLRLRKESQQTENENVTRKVWEFIGKRPVSAFSSYRDADSTSIDSRKGFGNDEINEMENAKLLKYITRFKKVS